MSWITLPNQLFRRAEFYRQLATLTSAGLGLPRALDMLQRQAQHRSYRVAIQHIAKGVADGNTFCESAKGVGDWMPALDGALLHAGEVSGRLPEIFRLLADSYESRGRLARQMISDLAYPLFVIHMAVFIIPLPQLVLSFNVVNYLGTVLWMLGPPYAVVLGVLYVVNGRHGPLWRARLESVLVRIPLLGTGLRELALGRLAAALEALVNAGVTLVEAWGMAALASGSFALCRTVEAWEPLMRSGTPPSQLVSKSREFPEAFAQLYETGEMCGQTDDTLRRLHTLYTEEGSRKLHWVAQWTPKVVYFAVMAIIAIYVIRAWMAHFQQIGDAINF